MGQETVTAAAVVSFSADLERRSADYYRLLAVRFPVWRLDFEGYGDACLKTAAQVQRVYQEAVTDALETGYSFVGLALDTFAFPQAAGAEVDVAQAIALEDSAAAFYEGAAQCSALLLATLARTFRRIARARRERCEALRSLPTVGSS